MRVDRFLHWLRPRLLSAKNVHAIAAPILIEIIDDYYDSGKFSGLRHRRVVLSKDERTLVVLLDFESHARWVEIRLPLAHLLQNRAGALDDMIASFKAQLDQDAETLHP
jgi:hypothetical protein